MKYGGTAPRLGKPLFEDEIPRGYRELSDTKRLKEMNKYQKREKGSL